MSYFSLAVKYRPKKLSDVLGHDFIIKIISNFISLDKVPIAIILTGSRGVGKTTIARLIGMILNCINLEKKNDIFDPCLKCVSCLSILNKTTVDIIELDAASNTSVESMRNLIEDCLSVPMSLKKKVYIIDECHMLSKSAFNALLKTLEEPNEFNIFIFATTEINKVPITILSRCQKFVLQNIKNENIFNNIKNIACTEDIKITDDAINLIVDLSKGSIRDSLSLLDQMILSNNDNLITINEIRENLNLEDIKFAIDVYFNCYISNNSELDKLLKIIKENNADIKNLLLQLLEININLMNILAFNANFNEESLNNLKRKISDLSLFNMPRLLRFYEILSSSIKSLSYLDEIIVLNALILKLSYVSNLPTPIEIIKILDNKEIEDISEDYLKNNEKHPSFLS